MKQLEYNKENFRLLAFIISKATSGSLFTKLLTDAGWSPSTTASKEWLLSKKSKEDFLFDEFVKIAEVGRDDILDFVLEKTVEKSSIYFKLGSKGYKFPKDSLSILRKRIGKKGSTTKKLGSNYFSSRKFHPSISFASKRLFQDGYYSQAIFEACKLLNKRVQELSCLSLDGKSLMQSAFSPNSPKVKLNLLENSSQKDEQEGFMHIFEGVMQGIRNPKGHEMENLTDPIRAVEYLSILSLLFRKLDTVKK